MRHSLSKKSAVTLTTSAIAIPILLLLPLSVSSQERLQVGYAVFNPLPGNVTPLAAAVLSFSNSDGFLVSEATVRAVEPIEAGRIFVDQDGAQTGLALVNVSDEPVTVDLTLRDRTGNVVEGDRLTLEPGEQLSRLVGVSGVLPHPREGFSGSLTFETINGGRLAAATFRLTQNPYGEPVFTTLPVVDLGLGDIPATSRLDSDPRVVLPHFGAGGPLSTRIILINRSGERIAGKIQLVALDGTPPVVQIDGIVRSKVGYELAPDGVLEATLSSPFGVVGGYAVITLEEGAVPPAATALLQYRSGESIVSEASLESVSATSAAFLSARCLK